LSGAAPALLSALKPVVPKRARLRFDPSAWHHCFGMKTISRSRLMRTGWFVLLALVAIPVFLRADSAVSRPNHSQALEHDLRVLGFAGNGARWEAFGLAYLLALSTGFLCWLGWALLKPKRDLCPIQPVPSPSRITEPELLLSTKPRRLEMKTGVWTLPRPLIGGFVIFVLLVGARIHDTYIERVHREFVIGHGEPAIGRVEKDETISRGRNPLTRLTMAYTATTGEARHIALTIHGLGGGYVGMTVPMHYLPEPGGDAVTDRPFDGATPINLALSLLVPLFIAGAVFLYHRYKIRYLLQWGTPVAATIHNVRGDMFGAITLTYQDGRFLRTVRAGVPAGSVFEVGGMLTAFVDRRYPNDAVIYSMAPYRVARA
jgi:hypothetical protein